MTLIKKTVVLVKDKTIGYITIIKLGDTAGAKLVLTEPVRGRMWLALKIGANPQLSLPFTDSTAEFNLVIDLNANDSIGAAIMDESFNIAAFGGRRDTVSIPALKAAIQEAQSEKPQKQEEAVPTAAEPVIPEVPYKAKGEDVVPAFEEGEKPPIESGGKTDAESEEKPAAPKGSPLSGKHAPKVEEREEPEIEIRAPGSSGKNPFDVPKGENFYQSVRARLNEILTINPRDERLEKVIPDSKWVRVKYDGEDYYVVGVLNDEGVTTHIAYGVPGRKGVKPPREAEEFCDFLPINGPDDGYWLMFQNAKDGSMIKN